MMKLVKMVWMLIVGLCVGTVVSQVILAAALFPRLKLDQDRIAQIFDIAQGKEIAPKAPAVKSTVPQVSEQVSHDQVLESRAVKFRNLELREQQLRNQIAQMQTDESLLVDETKKFNGIRTAFETQLADLKKNITSVGREELGRTLVSLEPDQAKKLLLEMLEKNEIDEVVLLLTKMTDKKRANILGEFQTEPELAKLSEVLRRLREGLPESKAVADTQALLGAKGTAATP